MEGREERGGVLMKGQLKCTAHTASARNAHSNFMVNWAMHLESYITEAYRETQCQIRKTHTHTHTHSNTHLFRKELTHIHKSDSTSGNTSISII